MKKAVYINEMGQVMFTIVPPSCKKDGYMLSLPPMFEYNSDLAFFNIVRNFYGIIVDRDDYPYDESKHSYPSIDKMSNEYVIVPFTIVDSSGSKFPYILLNNRESKFPYILLNKTDIGKLRESNTVMIKDNYSVIEDVFKALK